MSATLTLSDGTTRYVKHALTSETTTAFDSRMYRPPNGTTWRLEGTGQKEPQAVGVSIEVWAASDFEEVTSGGSTVTVSDEPVWVQTGLVASTLAGVAPVLEDIIADAEDATQLETLLGTWPLEGLQSAVPVPIAGGYRLDLTWLAATRRNVELDGAAIVVPTDPDSVVAGADSVVAGADSVVAS